MVRVLRFQASLPIKFWECVLPGTFTINRIPTIQLWGKSPYEKLFREKDKFRPTSRKYVFVGYPYGKKGWRLYDFEKQEFLISCEVLFHKDVFPFAEFKQADSRLSKMVFFENQGGR